MIKAMYFRFIVLLIVAQTRVYTNTDHFLSNFFLLSFIYCKRAGWKYSPLMAKWERGSKVREQGQQVVWLKGYTSTRRMGQDSCTKWTSGSSARGEADKKKLWPCTHRSWIDDRLLPRWQSSSGFGGGGALILELCPGPTSTIGTSDSGLLKRERKWRAPVVVSSTPAAVLCKSTMAESVLYTDRAARAEAEGLRHGKHSSLPKRVAASHSLRQQQMRHARTQTQRSHTFFHTEKRPHTDVYTPRRLLSGEQKEDE